MASSRFRYGEFSIPLGPLHGLCTLGPITMDFRDVYMSFTKEDHTCTLKGI